MQFKFLLNFLFDILILQTLSFRKKIIKTLKKRCQKDKKEPRREHKNNLHTKNLRPSPRVPIPIQLLPLRQFRHINKFLSKNSPQKTSKIKRIQNNNSKSSINITQNKNQSKLQNNNRSLITTLNKSHKKSNHNFQESVNNGQNNGNRACYGEIFD